MELGALVLVHVVLVLQVPELHQLATWERPRVIHLIVGAAEPRIQRLRFLDQRVAQFGERAPEQDRVVPRAVALTDVPQRIHEQRGRLAASSGAAVKRLVARQRKKARLRPGVGLPVLWVGLARLHFAGTFVVHTASR